MAPLVSRFAFVTALLVTAAPHAAAWPAQGLPVCTAAGSQFGVCAASDGAGGAIVVWVDQRSGGQDIYAQRVLAGGAAAWAANGVAVCDTSGAQLTPGIAADGAGGAFVAWYDERKGVSDPDIYIQHVTSSGTMAWTRKGVLVCGATLDQQDPKVVADGTGGAFVTWRDYRNTADYDLYAQRVSSAGAVLWTANGVPVCTAVLDQTSLACVPDGAGGELVAWQDYRGGGVNSDVFAQRVTSSGTSAWTANGVVVSQGVGLRIAYSPALTGDGIGGALVAWQDLRNGTADIYAQHVDSGGLPAWIAGGDSVCAFAQDQGTPLVVSDAAGGAIVAWEDLRAGTKDLYAQRMSGAGGRQWSAGGVPVCTALQDQEGAAGAPDGSGGMLIAWYDARNGVNNPDLYAQRITSAGQPSSGWAVDGAPICTAVNTQQSVALLARWDGGPLVAWQDYRSGTDYDVYARAIGGDGGTVAVVPGPSPVAFRLGEPRPNPARATSSLELELPAARAVTARVFDPSGRAVRALASGRTFEAGRHPIEWDGRDEAGAPVAPGLYFVRVEADREALVRRIVRLR